MGPLDINSFLSWSWEEKNHILFIHLCLLYQRTEKWQQQKISHSFTFIGEKVFSTFHTQARGIYYQDLFSFPHLWPQRRCSSFPRLPSSHWRSGVPTLATLPWAFSVLASEALLFKRQSGLRDVETKNRKSHSLWRDLVHFSKNTTNPFPGRCLA